MPEFYKKFTIVKIKIKQQVRALNFSEHINLSTRTKINNCTLILSCINGKINQSDYNAIKELKRNIKGL